MYVLFYDYVDDILQRRAPHRDAHLAGINASAEITLAGAFGDPPRGAVIVFNTDDAAIVEDFAANDPYVREGLVTERRIEPLAVVR
jgi:uncharacterized protein